MPCYRCRARQVDPARGPSPWKRGVRGDRQVLICPQCQSGRDWASDLDRCPSCGSVRLVRRLGDVECRDCGQVREPADTPAADVPAATDAPAPAGAPGPASRAPGEGEAPTDADDPAAARDSAATGDSAAALAEEVARALDRVLGSHRVSG